MRHNASKVNTYQVDLKMSRGLLTTVWHPNCLASIVQLWHQVTKFVNQPLHTSQNLLVASLRFMVESKLVFSTDRKPQAVLCMVTSFTLCCYALMKSFKNFIMVDRKLPWDTRMKLWPVSQRDMFFHLCGAT